LETLNAVNILNAETPGPVPAVPGQTSAYIAMSFGTEGYKAAAAWLDGADLFVPRRHMVAQEANGEALAKLQSILGETGAGYRLLLAGPADDLRAARSQALGSGAYEDILVLLPTD
jgi:dimethylamine monooxygenase subunit C